MGVRSPRGLKPVSSGASCSQRCGAVRVTTTEGRGFEPLRACAQRFSSWRARPAADSIALRSASRGVCTLRGGFVSLHAPDAVCAPDVPRRPVTRCPQVVLWPSDGGRSPPQFAKELGRLPLLILPGPNDNRCI